MWLDTPSNVILTRMMLEDFWGLSCLHCGQLWFKISLFKIKASYYMHNISGLL